MWHLPGIKGTHTITRSVCGPRSGKQHPSKTSLEGTQVWTQIREIRFVSPEFPRIPEFHECAPFRVGVSQFTSMVAFLSSCIRTRSAGGISSLSTQHKVVLETGRDEAEYRPGRKRRIRKWVICPLIFPTANRAGPRDPRRDRRRLSQRAWKKTKTSPSANSS